MTEKIALATASSVHRISPLFGKNSSWTCDLGNASSSKERDGPCRALHMLLERLGCSARGWLKMQNLNLTRWLKMVREALKEKDDAKRNHLLQAADEFLRSENLEPKSKLTRLHSRKLAA
jgi:hypothetical protein